MIEWVAANWTYLVVVLWVAEKVVKLTPTKYDDIVVDILGGALRKLVGKQSK